MPEEEIMKDPFIGVFDITFSNGTQKNAVALGVRIVNWMQSPNSELFYLISEDGSLYNFHNIAKMLRVGD